MGTYMNQLKRCTISGIIFVTILGTLSHFFYEWSGQNPIIGLLSPVSESTWEHMKLLFFPMLLFSFYMSGKLKEHYPCITASLYLGNLLGTMLIPVIFYTYTGILGFHLLFLDIAVFILSVIAGFYTAYRLTLSCRVKTLQSLLGLILIALAAAFFIFTYYPPNIALFHI